MRALLARPGPPSLTNWVFLQSSTVTRSAALSLGLPRRETFPAREARGWTSAFLQLTPIGGNQRRERASIVAMELLRIEREQERDDGFLLEVEVGAKGAIVRL